MNNFVYVHDLDPFLFRVRLLGHVLGPRWYGLAYVLGFVLTGWYFHRAAQRGTIPRLEQGAREHLLTAVVAGVFLGGRLGYVLQHPRQLLSDPWFVFRVWEGGMAFFGGLAGVLLAIAWVARRHRISFLTLLDVAVFPASLSLALGRIANFINAELVGRPTGGDWGVIFPTVDRAPRHPSQLYESASHFLLFAILVLVLRLRPSWSRGRAGRLSFLFLVLYGLFRFLTDFYRADETYLGPFSTGQWSSLLVSVIGVVGLWVLKRHRDKVAGGSRNSPPATGNDAAKR